MDDIKLVAAHAKDSASEIDIAKATAQAHGIDLDTVANDFQRRQWSQGIKAYERENESCAIDVAKLIEQGAIPENERDGRLVEELVKKYRANDVEDAIGRAALTIHQNETQIRMFQQAMLLSSSRITTACKALQSRSDISEGNAAAVGTPSPR